MNTPAWNDSNWIMLKESPPKDNEEVFLKCEYMMQQYITLGKMTEGGKHRLSSKVDEDLFFRSKIIGWKPVN